MPRKKLNIFIALLTDEITWSDMIVFRLWIQYIFRSIKKKTATWNWCSSVPVIVDDLILTVFVWHLTDCTGKCAVVFRSHDHFIETKYP